MDEMTAEGMAAPDQGMVAPQEKMLPQSQVNALIGREKAAVRQQMLAQMQQQQPQQMEPQGPQADFSQMEDRVFERMLAKAKEYEEMQARQEQERIEAEQRQQLEQVAQKYFMKIESGKDKLADFDEVMTDFDPGAFPQIAMLAAHTDNTAEVMYELAKNPHKLVQLNALAERSPKMAQREMTKLAQSISQNQQAIANDATPQAPLSRLKSSTTVGGDSGKMNIRDLRNQDWLRG